MGADGTPSSLQSLHLHGRGSLHSVTATELQCVFGILQMPCLQTLGVKNVTLPPTIPIFPQLRQLSYTPPLRDNKATVASMLSLLRCTPSLEKLEIGSGLATSDEVISGSTKLAKLSYLSYEPTQCEGSSLFRYISYPPSVQVFFRSQFNRAGHRPCLTSEHYIEDLKTIMSYMSIGNEAAVNAASVHLEDNGSRFIMRVHGGLKLTLDLKITPQDVAPLLRLSAMLPRSGAHTFRVYGFPLIKAEDWVTSFAQHECVQTLEISAGESNCVQALLKSSEAERPPFPQLKTLRLYDHDVTLRVALIEQVLKERRKLGTPIDSLVIGSCRVTKDIIERLEECVTVEWDGCVEIPVLNFDFSSDEFDSDKDDDDLGEDDDDGFHHEESDEYESVDD
ncbi:hypothetical protein EYR36_008776 [Pleurotus pulmonarius]|nr:hypothetical protein EYR36_008776 [Pleurotus pulmonarius]